MSKKPKGGGPAWKGASGEIIEEKREYEEGRRTLGLENKLNGEGVFTRHALWRRTRFDRLGSP